jgi:hypothetical protein
MIENVQTQKKGFPFYALQPELLSDFAVWVQVAFRPPDFCFCSPHEALMLKAALSSVLY